jgi:hypothetical protein
MIFGRHVARAVREQRVIPAPEHTGHGVACLRGPAPKNRIGNLFRKRIVTVNGVNIISTRRLSKVTMLFVLAHLIK